MGGEELNDDFVESTQANVHPRELDDQRQSSEKKIHNAYGSSLRIDGKGFCVLCFDRMMLGFLGRVDTGVS